MPAFYLQEPAQKAEETRQNQNLGTYLAPVKVWGEYLAVTLGFLIPHKGREVNFSQPL